MADAELKTRIKLRTDYYANWLAADPILLEGEVAVVIKATKTLFKVGDGGTPFSLLPWASEPIYEESEEMLEF